MSRAFKDAEARIAVDRAREDYREYCAESRACGYEVVSFAEYAGNASPADYRFDPDEVEDN